MRIVELARKAGVSTKAARYYERLGLVDPAREPNGYRSFGENDVRVVMEVRALSEIGISPSKAGPFVECLDLGHEHGDECVSSLTVYRDTITDLECMIDALSLRRDTLQQRLDRSAERSFKKENPMSDYTALPQGLPVPEDDGAAARFVDAPAVAPGQRWPDHRFLRSWPGAHSGLPVPAHRTARRGPAGGVGRDPRCAWLLD